MMLSFHTPEWAKVHADYREIVAANYEADEFALLVNGARRAVGLQTLLKAQRGGPAAYTETREFLNLWFANMGRLDIEFELTDTATAVWSWTERR